MADAPTRISAATIVVVCDPEDVPRSSRLGRHSHGPDFIEPEVTRSHRKTHQQGDAGNGGAEQEWAARIPSKRLTPHASTNDSASLRDDVARERLRALGYIE
jgi:hypothetical protein